MTPDYRPPTTNNVRLTNHNVRHDDDDLESNITAHKPMRHADTNYDVMTTITTSIWKTCIHWARRYDNDYHDAHRRLDRCCKRISLHLPQAEKILELTWSNAAVPRTHPSRNNINDVEKCANGGANGTTTYPHDGDLKQQKLV